MASDSYEWWEGRRRFYTLTLLANGPFSFILLCLVNPQMEITIFTLGFQGLAYLVMVGVANLFYNLGKVADWGLNRRGSVRFRTRLYAFGLALSIALPLALPTLVVAYRLHWPTSAVTKADVIGTWRSNRSFDGALMADDLLEIRADGTYNHTYRSRMNTEATKTLQRGDPWRIDEKSQITFDRFIWGADDNEHVSGKPDTWKVGVSRSFTGSRLYFDAGMDFYFAK